MIKGDIGADKTGAQHKDTDPGFRVMSLITAIVLALLLTLYPHIAMNRWGEADHAAALLLVWSMCAGFVRGVGFIPQHRVARVSLSGPACLFALVLALLRIAGH